MDSRHLWSIGGFRKRIVASAAVVVGVTSLAASLGVGKAALTDVSTRITNGESTAALVQGTLDGVWTETITVIKGPASNNTHQLMFTRVAGSAVEYDGTYMGQDASGNLVPVWPQIHFRAWLVTRGQDVLLTIRQFDDNGGYYATRDAFSSTLASSFTGELIDIGSGAPLSGNYCQWEMHRSGASPSSTASPLGQKGVQ